MSNNIKEEKSNEKKLSDVVPHVQNVDPLLQTNMEEELLKRLESDRLRISFRDFCQRNADKRNRILSKLGEIISVTVTLAENRENIENNDEISENSINNDSSNTTSNTSNNSEDYENISDNNEETKILLAVVLKGFGDDTAADKKKDEKSDEQNKDIVANEFVHNINLPNISVAEPGESVSPTIETNSNDIMTIKIVSNNNAMEIIKRLIENRANNQVRMTILNPITIIDIENHINFNGTTMEEILKRIFEIHNNNTEVQENISTEYLERQFGLYNGSSQDTIVISSVESDQEDNLEENDPSINAVINTIIEEENNDDEDDLELNQNQYDSWYFSEENTRKRCYTMTNVYIKQPKRLCVHEDPFDWTNMLMIPGCHFQKPRALFVPKSNNILIPTFNRGIHNGYSMTQFTNRQEIQEMQLNHKFANNTDFTNNLILKAVEFPGLGYQMIFENDEKPIFLPENMNFMEWSDDDVADWYDNAVLDFGSDVDIDFDDDGLDEDDEEEDDFVEDY